MKFLTICEGGMVRSVCCAIVLRTHQHDTLPASWRFTSAETMAMLMEWADYIVVMSQEISEKMLEKHPELMAKYAAKVRLLDVGEDVWGDPYHPELFGIVEDVVCAWQMNGWQIHEDD